MDAAEAEDTGYAMRKTSQDAHQWTRLPKPLTYDDHYHNTHSSFLHACVIHTLFLPDMHI
jgi:hypothetical protein